MKNLQGKTGRSQLSLDNAHYAHYIIKDERQRTFESFEEKRLASG